MPESALLSWRHLGGRDWSLAALGVAHGRAAAVPVTTCHQPGKVPDSENPTAPALS